MLNSCRCPSARVSASSPSTASGLSRRSTSLTIPCATSIRKPAIPRSNQNRRMSSNADRTSSFHQFRSGCSAQEVVEVVLLRGLVPRPRGTSEHGHPVVRRRSVGPRVGPHVPVAVLGGPARSRVHEPRMSVARVVRHEIEDHPDAVVGRASDQTVERRQIAEVGMRHRGSRRRRSPNRRSATGGSGSARSRRRRATPDGRGGRSPLPGRRGRRRSRRRTTAGTADTGRPTATSSRRQASHSHRATSTCPGSAVVVVERPRDGLRERPAARAFAVEVQLAGQPVQPMDDGISAVTELPPADGRGDAELPLPRERLRIDQQPRLALRRERRCPRACPGSRGPAPPAKG